jgi:hypothetical protein
VIPRQSAAGCLEACRLPQASLFTYVHILMPSEFSTASRLRPHRSALNDLRAILTRQSDRDSPTCQFIRGTVKVRLLSDLACISPGIVARRPEGEPACSAPPKQVLRSSYRILIAWRSRVTCRDVREHRRWAQKGGSPSRRRAVCIARKQT